jgi:hypothetical protein
LTVTVPRSGATVNRIDGSDLDCNRANAGVKPNPNVASRSGFNLAFDGVVLRLYLRAALRIDLRMNADGSCAKGCGRQQRGTVDRRKFSPCLC